MKQVSAKHYYYIALHIITTQKQRYVPQLIVHVDIIRAECEFLQLMLLRTKISLPWATYIIISSVSGSETWPKQYINKQEKAVFFCTTSGIWHTSCMKSHFKEHFLLSWSNNTGLLSVFYDRSQVTPGWPTSRPPNQTIIYPSNFSHKIIAVNLSRGNFLHKQFLWEYSPLCHLRGRNWSLSSLCEVTARFA